MLNDEQNWVLRGLATDVEQFEINAKDSSRFASKRSEVAAAIRRIAASIPGISADDFRVMHDLANDVLRLTIYVNDYPKFVRERTRLRKAILDFSYGGSRVTQPSIRGWRANDPRSGV